jgi:hypothetical protein
MYFKNNKREYLKEQINELETNRTASNPAKNDGGDGGSGGLLHISGPTNLVF